MWIAADCMYPLPLLDKSCCQLAQSWLTLQSESCRKLLCGYFCLQAAHLSKALPYVGLCLCASLPVYHLDMTSI